MSSTCIAGQTFIITYIHILFFMKTISCVKNSVLGLFFFNHSLKVYLHWNLYFWGRNSSVGRVWACCPQRSGFDPPLETFSGRGDFSLGVNMGSNSIPPKNSFGWEYKPRSSLCTHAFHRTDSKDPDIHVLDGWMPATKTHPACTIHEDGMWLP